ETLGADRRDRLFEALGKLDHPDAINPIAQITSRYGTYLAWVEAQIDRYNEKLRKWNDRQGLSMDEIGLRASAGRKLGQVEEIHKHAENSFQLLIGIVGGYENPRTIEKALVVFFKSPTWRVRYLLAGACARWHEGLKDVKASKRAFATLKKLQKDATPRVRVAVARSLGAFKRAEALELLAGYIKDPDWRVRAAAVESLQKTGSAEAVGTLIAALKGEKGRLRDDINTALKEMTGQSHGFADVWARWWASVGGKIPAKKEGDAGDETWRNKARGANFYGIRIQSDRIIYIMDVSGSMAQPIDPLKRKTVVTGRPLKDGGPAPGKTRFEVAQNEMKRAVSKLHRKAYFTIIFFSHAVITWQREMVQATPANKKKAYEAINKARPIGATYTLGALREAFTLAGVIGRSKTARDGPKVDTIFLLSDGAPTDGSFDSAKLMDPEIILEAVRQWNKDINLKIHTVAVDITDNYFLRTLATEHGGQWVERKTG
ncbi:MAG: HEAT repeat domain-containing protein, partial [Planctomycetota bacterium]|nr:HEAT repeat domain-containing protein [Planctomycetota bacterium]